jgi:hypothetical protein
MENPTSHRMTPPDAAAGLFDDARWGQLPALARPIFD